jgi:hypothetical protein
MICCCVRGMFGLTVDAMLLCEGNVWADSGCYVVV